MEGICSLPAISRSIDLHRHAWNPLEPEGTSEPCIPLGTLKLVPKSDSGEWKEIKIDSFQGSVLMVETVQMNFMVNDSKIKRHSRGSWYPGMTVTYIYIYLPSCLALVVPVIDLWWYEHSCQEFWVQVLSVSQATKPSISLFVYLSLGFLICKIA